MLKIGAGRYRLKTKRFRCGLTCGDYEEFPDGFLCFIEPRRPSIRKLFRTIDTTQRIARVADALEAALKAHPDVHSIRW